MKVNVKTISAFTIDGKGGNIAGLVLDADRFTTYQKQRIAAQANFNETAFVSRSALADFKLEFFTPIKQIAHCGHATIATFSYLKKEGFIKGILSSKETIDGTRQIFFEKEHAFMEQVPGNWSYCQDVASVAKSLNISTTKLISAPVIVNTGNSFLLAELKSEQELYQIAPDFNKISAISKQYNLIGFYLYVKTGDTDIVATTRMFAPYYGIEEESATGMAAGPLGWWLYTQNRIQSEEFILLQGNLMKPASPSHLHVLLNREGKAMPNIFVGGSGTFLSEIELSLEA